MYCYQSCYQSTGGRACDDTGQQATKKERFHNANMAQTEYSTTLENKSAPAKRLSRVVDKVQLHLIRQDGVGAVQGRWATRGQSADVLDGLGDLGDVLVDQVLGARERAVVELRGGQVPEVSDEAGAEEVDELVKVILLPGNGEGVEALGDEPPVVIL